MPRVRRGHVAGVAAGAVVVIAAALAAMGLGGADGQGGAAASARPVTTAPIMRETLVVEVIVDGEVSYGETVPVPAAAAGTVTWLPPVGATVTRGQTLLRVNEQPVVLLYGPLPMFRTLAAGMRGTDVAQLEANLKELGHGEGPVDQVFTDATARAVKRWQKSLGLTETGTVDIGHVVYAADAVRIAEHRVRVGAPSSGAVLGVTGTTKLVGAKVAVPDAGWAKPGTKVTVLAPDGKSTAATVATVATEAAQAQRDGQPGAPGAAEPTVLVTFSVADQAAIAAFDKTPVKVRYVARELPDVLTVPVVALLALAEGGYGLEIVDGSAGASRIVAVQAGEFAGARVEVRGDGLREGMRVVVPS